MPMISCPHCEERQSVSADMVGLTVNCGGCGQAIRVPSAIGRPKPRPRPAEPEEADPEPANGDVRKTVLLLGGLILLVVAVLGGLYLAAQPSKKAPEAKDLPAARAEPSPAVKPTFLDDPPRRGDAGVSLGTLLDLGRALLAIIALLFTAYVVGVLVTGVMLARDATARGLPPVPWLAVYFLAHLIGPILASSVATVLIAVHPLVALLGGAVLGLTCSWYGLIVYAAVRRPGRLAKCPRCGNGRLKTLVTCPHCGRTDSPEA